MGRVPGTGSTRTATASSSRGLNRRLRCPTGDPLSTGAGSGTCHVVPPGSDASRFIRSSADLGPGHRSRQLDRNLTAGWPVPQVDGAPMGRDDGAAHRQAEAVSRSRAGGAGLVAAPSGGERSLPVNDLSKVSGLNPPHPSRTCTRTAPSLPLTTTVTSAPGRV